MDSHPRPAPAYLIPADQMGKLSRWARVAVIARAATRTAPWFAPGGMRAQSLAMGDFMAIDSCTTLAMLAAVNARQLAPQVAEAATRAALNAIAAPGRIPLSPPDHAAMLAGMAVEGASMPVPATHLDTGSHENLLAARDDVLHLLTVGMEEKGYEYAVPRDLFARPLWPRIPEGWREQFTRWQEVLGQYNLLEFSERYKKQSEGLGLDWGEAQRRAEAWVRMMLRTPSAPVTANRSGFAVPASPFPSTPATEPQLPRPFELNPAAKPAISPEPYAEPIAVPVAPLPPRQVHPRHAAPPTLEIPPPPPGAAAFSDLEPYAYAITGFIEHIEPDRMVTLAIQGPGGSGRSILGGMVQRRLANRPSQRSDQPHLNMWFDASRQRASQALAMTFMQDLAARLDRERPTWRRHLRRLPAALQRPIMRFKYVAAILACIAAIAGIGTGAFLLLASNLPPDWVPMKKDLVHWIGETMMDSHMTILAVFCAILVLTALVELWGFIAPFAGALVKYVRDPLSMAEGENQDKVRAQLKHLLQTALPPGNRMVVFVEDLERAGAGRAVEFLESLRTTFHFPELVFVLLTDAEKLTSQIHSHAHLANFQWNQFVDLQVDLPERGTSSGSSRSSSSKSKSLAPGSGGSGGRPGASHSKGLAAFWGPWSRKWRGDLILSDVLLRTIYVDPPYLAPLAMIAWIFLFIPLTGYVAVQRSVYPDRCKQVFTNTRSSLLTALLVVGLISHSVLLFQTINGLLTNRRFVILWPDALPRSIWVFLPMEIVVLAVVMLLGVLDAVSRRYQEGRVLKRARALLKTKLDQGATDPITAVQALTGSTLLPAGEDILIRQAIEQRFLSSEPDPLNRLQALVDFSLAVQATQMM